MIEKIEKFWDNRPCNIRHSDKMIGTDEYYNEVEAKKFFVEPHIIPFSQFPIWENKNVLEIGCGLGTTGINFVRNGAIYTGVELSKNTLDLAQKRFKVSKEKGSFYYGNAEKLSSFLPLQTFDLIYSFGVIHHTPKPERIISELKKYMSPNSILKIMLYAKFSWKNCMIQLGLDRPEAQYGCPIARTYTKKEINNLLYDFDIISIEQDHIFPYKVDQYKKGNYIKHPWFRIMPNFLFKIMEKKIGWHLLITAKLKS